MILTNMIFSYNLIYIGLLRGYGFIGLISIMIIKYIIIFYKLSDYIYPHLISFSWLYDLQTTGSLTYIHSSWLTFCNLALWLDYCYLLSSKTVFLLLHLLSAFQIYNNFSSIFFFVTRFLISSISWWIV